MICSEVALHFKSAGTWIDWDRCVDSFTAGDDGVEISGIAVAWKPSWEDLRQAVDLGANLFIAHESIAVRTDTRSDKQDIEFALPSERPLFEWIEENGITVYRCHDFLDQMPEKGVRWTWHRGLELGGEISADEYPHLVSEVPPTRLGDLVQHVLRKTGGLGQDGVIVYGDLDRIVHRVATGTGAISLPPKMKELGADTAIVTDDFFLHVRMGAHIKDLDLACIIVNHGVAEEWAIANLAEYLRVAFPDTNVSYLPQSCPYTVVTLDDK